MYSRVTERESKLRIIDGLTNSSALCHILMSVYAPHASLLNKAILLPAVITAVYSRQIYRLQLSRLSDSLRLPLSCEGVSVFLSLSHYVGSSAGSSGSTYSVFSSCSSSPPFSCSIGGPSACEVQSRV